MIIDQISVTKQGHVQVREYEMVDGEKKYHRFIVERGDTEGAERLGDHKQPILDLWETLPN